MKIKGILIYRRDYDSGEIKVRDTLKRNGRDYLSDVDLMQIFSELHGKKVIINIEVLKE